jgi:formylglycine-generating enzyme required for sulfatase activity
LFPLVGNWLNEDQFTYDITRLNVSYGNGNYSVQIWNPCIQNNIPDDCVWNGGNYNVSTITTTTMSIVWTFNSEVVTLNLEILPDGRLEVVNQTHFTDKSKGKDYVITEHFIQTRSNATTTSAIPGVTPIATQTSSKDGMIMVNIPAGEFTMGSNDGTSDEKPAHTVYLDAFWIDKTEVTTAMYINCVNAQGCNYPNYPDRSNFSGNWGFLLKSGTGTDYWNSPDLDNYPMITVTWDEANAYCEWAGRRLPTEAEWEKAARWTDARIYPWGNTPPTSVSRAFKDGSVVTEVTENGNKWPIKNPIINVQFLGGVPEIVSFPKSYLDSLELNYNQTIDHPREVGYYEEGASPYGVLDMAGNVWDYVSDFYDKAYYINSPKDNPTGPASGNFHVVRGGSWNSLNVPNSDVRTTSRSEFIPSDLSYSTTGFRCAMSP